MRFRASGKSMRPTIQEGEMITLEPVKASGVKRGDIILYRSGKGVIAHRVTGIQERKEDSRVFILRGDASTSDDEPVHSQQILGRVIFVERDGRSINLKSGKARLFPLLRISASDLKRRMSHK